MLGGERAATFTYGAEGDRLGDALASDGGTLAAAAPGRPAVWHDGAWTDGPSAWVGFWRGALVRVGAGDAVVDGGVFDAEQVALLTGAGALAASPVGLYALRAGEVVRVDTGARVTVPGAQALAADEARVAVLACPADEPCAVALYDVDLAPLAAPTAAGEPLPAGSGGAVGFDQGVLCAADPELPLDDGTGVVGCEDGRGAVGLPGDHLGGGIGAGHAVGWFNGRIAPARARLVPLDGGEVLALEVGAETQPIRLGGDDATLWIGAPFHPHAGAPSGALVRVDR